MNIQLVFAMKLTHIQLQARHWPPKYIFGKPTSPKKIEPVRDDPMFICGEPVPTKTRSIDIVRCGLCWERIRSLKMHPVMPWRRIISRDDIAAVTEIHGNFYFCRVESHISYWRAFNAIIVVFHVSGNCYLIESPPAVYEHIQPTAFSTKCKIFNADVISGEFRRDYIAIVANMTPKLRLKFLRENFPVEHLPVGR